MSRILSVLTAIIIICQSAGAEFTIHVYSPWCDDTSALRRDSLRMIGNYEAGYYPGTSMTPEGGCWFYFTYSSITKTSGTGFKIVDWIGPNSYDGYVAYPATFSIDSLFAQYSSSTNDIWIYLADTNSVPVVTDYAPAGNKMIYFLSPWDIGGVRVVIDGVGSPKMKMDTSVTRCGWFRYPYFGQTDSVKIKFMNSLDSSIYSTAGVADGDFINISTAMSAADTVWIYPVPYPSGTPAIVQAFPNVTATCRKTLLLAATVRDIDTTHPDFAGFGSGYKNGTKTGCWGDYNSAITGIVQDTLGSDDKPLLNSKSPCPIDSFNWFYTKYIYGKYPNIKCYNIKLTKNEDGLFYYDNQHFFIADDFLFLDSSNTVANPWWGGGTETVYDTSSAGTITSRNVAHNYCFTMEISAQFQYTKGQTFYFRGDDDVWAFINRKLAVDDGGIHNGIEKSISLDTFGLTAGKTYDFNLFFCERNPPGSSFKMLTSLNLYTNSNLFTMETQSGNTRTINMYEKVTQNNLSCDLSQAVVDTQAAVVAYYIQGPSFTTETLLSSGTSYGGINISSDYSKISIDTTNITGLEAGTYIITYYLSSDNSQSGTITFTVTALPAHHYDLLTDSMTLSATKDAQLDSIVIGMFDTTKQAYAVIRDSTGQFIKRAGSPAWTSRDEQIVTIAQSPTDTARCIITKIATGATWVVVSDPSGKLKPDSVWVVSYVLPDYPVITSAVMQDTNADIIPDMLNITLNDTFKTEQSFDSIIISYRNNTYTIAASNAVISGTSISVPFSSLSGTDGVPTGQVTLYMTSGGNLKTNSAKFTDGVDPAVIAGAVLENDGTGPDTLFLTFSEPVQKASLAGNQLLLIKANTTDTLTLNVLGVLAKTNDSTYTVYVTSSGEQPKAGDRLRLMPGTAGGTISDASKNYPHLLNPSIILALRKGPTAIVTAAYRDGNADGIIDTVDLFFKYAVSTSEFSSLTAKWDVLTSIYYDTIDISVIKKVNDSFYMAPIHGSRAFPGKVCTNASIEVFAEYDSFPDLPARSATAIDSAAPVIDSAKLVYGNSLASDSSSYNILTVSFSETMPQITDDHPFLLKAIKNGSQYQFKVEAISSSGKKCTFKVDTIDVGTVVYALKGDSIWIATDAGVADESGNAQINILNRRVPLSVTTQPAQWVISVVPNPFSPNAGTGTKIALSSKVAIIDADLYKIKLGIFDVIGNNVTTVNMTYSGGSWIYEWNGCNRFGRNVSSGVYTGILTINKESQGTETRRVKIGIKR
jgi:fibro-slime domain-containing protein